MVGSGLGTRTKQLRRRLLDDAPEGMPPAMRDCCAHMLLYLDEPDAMRQIALSHLMERFDATRADIGFGSADDRLYRAHATRRRNDCAVPDMQGRNLPNRNYGIQLVWRSQRAVQIDAERDPLFDRLRPMVQELSIRVKLARRLEHEGEVFGIVCLDQTVDRRVWSAKDEDYLDRFVTGVLSPLLAENRGRSCAGPTVLTLVERRVAELASQGMSYKQIARELNKSPNTVDNQLRKIRAKLGVRNQVALTRALDSMV